MHNSAICNNREKINLKQQPSGTQSSTNYASNASSILLQTGEIFL